MSEHEDLDRYSRQMRFAPLGEAGQRKLLESRALLVGVGALGSIIASTLVRAGVGHLRIVDRDFLELNNLQRQVLYDEDDVRSGLPKAIVAAEKLRRINSQVTIEPIVGDVQSRNVLALAKGCQVLIDGTDNFETRFLLNDTAMHLGTPWVYGGCLGAEGQTLTILPGETPCLRCLMPDPPPPGYAPTCDSAGILGPIVQIVGSLEAMEAIKILSGNRAAVSRTLTVLDVWDSRVRQVRLDGLSDRQQCPACSRRELPWLHGDRGSKSALLCGRNAVQLRGDRHDLVLDELASRLKGLGEVIHNEYLLRLTVGEHQITVFDDGRAIITGTDDPAQARALYARYIGS